MKKIAILGCENSHADQFLKFIKEKPEFSDVEVVGIYSDEAEACQKLHEKFGVPILGNYTDAVGKIDGLVITARHGDNHYRYAKPYIASGIPMFIDKPITINESEAVAFMRELEAHDVRISGGSSLKQDSIIAELKRDAEEETDGKTIGGLVRAPIKMNSRYGGFYFYAQHLVEMVSEIFGRYPKSVTVKQNGSQLHVLFHYDAYDCVGLYTDESSLYFAARMAEKGAKAFNISLESAIFDREFAEFYALLCGETQKGSYRDFIAPVFVMNAIERSLATGNEEAVNAINL